MSAVLNVSSAPTATLTWVDNARYETGYAIEVLDSTSGVWSRIAELPANSTSWTSEVLDFGATYVYSVVALTSDASSVSASVEIVVGDVPSAPSDLTSTLDVSKSATLVWVDNADSEEGYVVELQGADGSWSRAAELPANSTSWTSEALGSNGTYVYRVSAWNAYGFSSWVETEVLGASAPSAPSDLAFGAYDAVRKTLAMSWTDNSDNETSFRVEYSVDGGAWKLATTLGANATGRVATGVKANSLYSFRVRAENAYGVSDWAYGDYATTPATDVVSEAFADFFAEEDAEDDFWFEFEKALGKRR